MGRSYPVSAVEYSEQLSINLDVLDNRERLNLIDVVSHGYLRRIFQQYESFGL